MTNEYIKIVSELPVELQQLVIGFSLQQLNLSIKWIEFLDIINWITLRPAFKVKIDFQFYHIQIILGPLIQIRFSVTFSDFHTHLVSTLKKFNFSTLEIDKQSMIETSLPDINYAIAYIACFNPNSFLLQKASPSLFYCYWFEQITDIDIDCDYFVPFMDRFPWMTNLKKVTIRVGELFRNFEALEYLLDSDVRLELRIVNGSDNEHFDKLRKFIDTHHNLDIVVEHYFLYGEPNINDSLLRNSKIEIFETYFRSNIEWYKLFPNVSSLILKGKPDIQTFPENSSIKVLELSSFGSNLLDLTRLSKLYELKLSGLDEVSQPLNFNKLPCHIRCLKLKQLVYLETPTKYILPKYLRSLSCSLNQLRKLDLGSAEHLHHLELHLRKETQFDFKWGFLPEQVSIIELEGSMFPGYISKQIFGVRLGQSLINKQILLNIKNSTNIYLNTEEQLVSMEDFEDEFPSEGFIVVYIPDIGRTDFIIPECVNCRVVCPDSLIDNIRIQKSNSGLEYLVKASHGEYTVFSSSL